MCNKTKDRDSNFELLSIVAMLMMMFHHFAVHWSFDFWVSMTLPSFRMNFMAIWWKMWVDIFMLISWYFLMNSKKISLKKIFKLYLQMVFYSMFTYLIFWLMVGMEFDISTLVQTFLPIWTSLRWFASTYFILYLMHPYLNKFLLWLEMNTYKKLLMFSMLCFCIIPTFTIYMWWWNNLLRFIILYAIAWYMKMYWFKNFNMKYYMMLFLMSLMFSYMTSMMFSILWTKFVIFNTWVTYFYWQDKLTTLITSFTLFMIFKSMKLKNNKFMNILWGATFWVYLIHDHPVISDFLRLKLFKNNMYQNTNKMIIYSMLCVMMVYTLCTVIELLSKYLIENQYLSMINKYSDIMQKKYMWTLGKCKKNMSNHY